MKLKKLNKALVAAGLVAGAAISMPSQAVMMSEDGTGEVLIFPFYTVQGPADAPRTTLFTINNTTANYKAVKVRFHEAHNSRDALDFNLYLSPNDVWTGVVSRNAAGVAQLTTTDTSCTIPSSIMVSNNAFSTLAFTQNGNNDGGNQNELRTNEGYVEVIEMGEIVIGTNILVGGAAPVAAAPLINDIDEAILHINNIPGGSLNAEGIPVGCEALQATASTTGTWRAPVNGGSIDNTHIGVTQPTGGLTGSAMIVQASQGTVAAYNATALKHFYDVESDAVCGLGIDVAGGLYCETNGDANAATTTNRAFDDLHSFKDLDTTSANARSIQTYPNLAMAFPQVSTIFDPELVDTDGAAPVDGVINLEWAENEAVSTGVTPTAANTLFASVRDLQTTLTTDGGVAGDISDPTVATNCGGIDGVASAGLVAGDICANARPVSAVLAKSALINEYVLEQDAAAGIDFRTDVVVTFPTKWYFSDNGLYDGTVAGSVQVVDGASNTVGTLEAVELAPFSAQFVSSDTKRDQACERFSINEADVLAGGMYGELFNREEAKPNVTSNGLVPSPAINADTEKQIICHESNVLTLNDGDLLTSRIANGLGASVANSADGTNAFNIDFPADFQSGWFTMAFDTTAGGKHRMTSVAGPMAAGNGAGAGFVDYNIAAPTVVEGLPALGFVVEGLVVGAEGFSGNFTLALPHKSK